MSKNLWLYGLGLVAACAMLAAPQAAQAQNYQRGGYGQNYAPSRNYTPGYGNSGYAPGYGNYNPGSNSYSPNYGGYGYDRRPVIVHPQYEHYTPGRGYHEHGHYHVPHRGHSHTRPY